jgi:tRNA pseudouridine38-40 synthase
MIKLVVEYDGGGLCGWQRQPNGPTVQAHLEDALATLLEAPTRVTGSSRTDAGVHARGQVAAFVTDRDIPVIGIRRALNALLPPSIAIASAEEVDPAFHPRYWATGKHYRYLLLVRPERSPRWAPRAWHRRGPVDRAAMTEAAAVLVGQHDFAAFRAEGCSARTTIRRIEALTLSDLSPDEPGVLAFDVRGDAFLRHMVRIVVGTLVDVGDGRRQPSQLAGIVASRDRAAAGPTAPAHGLELIEVFYDGRRPRPEPGV